MKDRRKKYGEKQREYLIGMYEKKYSKTGLLQIPESFVRPKKNRLYCVKMKYLLANVEMLKCFYTYEEMETCVSEWKNEEDYRVDACSIHLILPLFHYIRLPKGFYNTKMDMFEQKMRLIGMGTGFEIWKEADYLKMAKEWESVESIFDEDFFDI